jgi:hypothetical protein
MSTSRTFACAECGARAAEIVVSAGEVRREAHTGVMIKPVTPELRERIAAALADPAALLAIDLELAPFWCPVCEAGYCADHWRRELVFDHDPLPAWLDSIRGECPYGHERMVED